MKRNDYRPLTAVETKVLESRNCSADDWDRVMVRDPFVPERLYGVIFHGECRLGRLDGTVTAEGGRVRRAGIYRTTLDNVTTEDNVLLNQINGYIANYYIKNGAIIQGIGVMEADPKAAFGNGVEVEAVNEGGGRDIPIFEELSAQLAHIMAMHRYRPDVVQSLRAIIKKRVEQARNETASVGAGAIIRNVPHMTDIKIGPGAIVIGAAYLSNGTILSEPEAGTLVGSGVVAKDFIIGEGSTVADHAILDKVFVGQGTKIGKQYSAENCLIFANCEFFHGEGVSLFAGPYTVSHHKATLMIAGLFSFFNAGSGSNQSNHMYKLGPIHQGVLERGSKTGSFSYLLWPCRIGPFSVVIGKHMDNFDISALPFSYISAVGERTYVVPGMNLLTVGTVRDGAKWPSRDRRRSSTKRDLVVFDVLSPYTVGRMLKGEAVCNKVYEATPRDVEDVTIGGALVRRRLLRSGRKTYSTGIEMYLTDQVFKRAEAALENTGSLEGVREALAEPEGALFDNEWVDISGLLAPRKRILELEQEIEQGRFSSIEELTAALVNIFESYREDAWAWVVHAYRDRFGKTPAELDAEELSVAAEAWVKARSRFIKAVLADAEKEYADISQIGFGIDGSEGTREMDFQQVRGTYGADKFVKRMQSELDEVQKRAEKFISRIPGLS